MQNKESRRSSICRVSLITLAESSVTNIPGDPFIKVTGNWDELDYSNAEFSEQLSSDGSFYDISLSISFSDSSPDKKRELLAWVGIYIIARLDYTDGTSRVIGTDQFPVVMSLSGEGSPHTLRMSYKGQQPESSKFL